MAEVAGLEAGGPGPGGPSGRSGADEGPRRAPWWRRRSLTSRVIVLTTTAVALAVALVALGAYLTVRTQLQHTLDRSLVERAKDAAKSPTLRELTDNYEIRSLDLGAADVRTAFLTRGSPDAFTHDSGPAITLGKPELDVLYGRSKESVRTITAGGEDYRVVVVPSPGGHALMLAQPLANQELVLEDLGKVTLLFGLLGVLAAAATGWVVARSSLRPVRVLTTTVERIARTEQLDPMPVEGDDELARLATSFNQMLVALSASRDRQRQLVADAGHELRTPLTSLRTNLDLLAQVDADGSGRISPEARAELLADVRAQIEELSTLVGDLVELARDEPMATTAATHGPVELHEVVEAALARVRRRAPSVTFHARLQPWVVDGEAGALERAATNLLDNAAKWSPSDGEVWVRLVDGVLTVEDEGPGIAEADLPHVFERFYRSPESRTMPGSGLGLAIVSQVAERHAGSVRAARSTYGGALLELRVPGAAPAGREEPVSAGSR